MSEVTVVNNGLGPIRAEFHVIVDTIVSNINMVIQHSSIIKQRDIAKIIYELKPIGRDFTQHQSHDLGYTTIQQADVKDLINHEWLFDLCWLKHNNELFGQVEIILACEIEFSYNMSNYKTLLQDFQKVVTSSAPCKLFIVKCMKEHNGENLMGVLVKNVLRDHLNKSTLAIIVLNPCAIEKVMYNLYDIESLLKIGI